VIFGQRFLTVKSTAVEVTAKAGELVETTATATVNLPAATTANLPVAVFCTVGVLSLKATHGEKIRGGPIEAAEVKFAVNQWAILYPDGVNWLMFGEPKREQLWSVRKPYEKSAEKIEPSKTRPARVMLRVRVEENQKGWLGVFVGGVELPEMFQVQAPSLNDLILPYGPFDVNPGQTWQAALVENVSVEYQTLLL